MNKFKYLLLAASLFASSAVFTSCDDGDDDNTANPAEEVVKASKKHDTAILLCTFGSTFKESTMTYDANIGRFPERISRRGHLFVIYLPYLRESCRGRDRYRTLSTGSLVTSSRKCRLQEGSGTVLTHHPG